MDTYQIVMIILGIASALAAFMIPMLRGILNLNTNIATLNTTLNRFENEYNKSQEAIDERVTTHGEQIDQLKIGHENHEVRITNLEKTK